MTIRDDIREMEQSHKFDGQSKQGRRRSAMLYIVSMDGGTDGVIAGMDEGGLYIATSDRWLMIEDDQGFFEAIRCANHDEAEALGLGIAAG